MAIAAASAVACSPVSGTDFPAPSGSAPRTSDASSAVASAAPAPSASASAAGPESPRPRLRFTTLLDRDRVHGDAADGISFVTLALPDGAMLVVVNGVTKAFTVKGDAVTALPKFFDGLRSPAPTWPADAFYVSSLAGTLERLGFSIYAPATEYQDEVSGRPGHWKTRSGKRTGAIPKQAKWIEPATISVPFTTLKGARFYEAAPEAFAPAKGGFDVRFDGPAKEESLPVPAPGTGGCRYAIKGHPAFTQSNDGTLYGIGTLCTSGEDELSTAKLDGVGPPFQSLGPRLNGGALAVEVWRDRAHGKVLALPGAEQVSEFAPFDFVWVPADKTGKLYVVSQVTGSRRNQSYVAELADDRFRDITPPSPPELFEWHVTATGELLLLEAHRSYRRRGAEWQTIAMESTKECADSEIYQVSELASGDLLLRGTSCLWHLPRGGSFARVVESDETRRFEGVVVVGGRDYGFVNGPSGEELVLLSIEMR